MTPVVLDTCAWIWSSSNRKRLSPAAAEAIAAARGTNRAFVSVISCWEVAKLVEKGRLSFRVPVGEWVERALGLAGLTLKGLSPEIAVASTRLPGDFHGDPADQLIVATARMIGGVVVTADRAIRRYRHVPTVW